MASQMNSVTHYGSFSTVWPDTSRIGRATAEVVRSMGAAQFVGFGHISTAHRMIYQGNSALDSDLKFRLLNKTPRDAIFPNLCLRYA